MATKPAAEATSYPFRPLNPGGPTNALLEALEDIDALINLLDGYGAACLSEDFEADGRALRWLAQTLAGAASDIHCIRKTVQELEVQRLTPW